MDEQKARLLLQSFRGGTEDAADPEFAEALREAQQNPALGEWLAEEQAFDRNVAAKLAALPEPFGLKTRILAQAARSAPVRRWSLAVIMAGVVALLFLTVQLVGLFRSGPQVPPATENDFVREMVSFVRLDPPLDVASDNLGTITKWLTQNQALPVKIPDRLVALNPAGCRVLVFRGQNVALICFQRGNNRLAHLFVVGRQALPLLAPGNSPMISRTGEWMTACWAEGDQVYMIALKGDRAALEQYLPGA